MLPPEMPFGKFRGQKLTDIPSSYLAWLIRECRGLDDELRAEVLAVLRKRGVDASGPECRAAVSWEPLVKTWYARLSLQFHPDRGGNHQAMVAINAARELLVALLRQAG